MNERICERTTRVPGSSMTTFLNSAAPDDFKVMVQEVLDQLAPCDRLDEASLLETDPALLARIEASSGAGLDLFRVLRGERLNRSTSSRKNVSASLRHKLHKQQSPLSDASYPVGHLVPVMAWVYFGSIDAWVAGRPGRACLPKGYWRQRANQVAALQRWAKANPEKPLTHTTLNAAGLHALAVALNGAALAALAAELGLERHLKRHQNGYWTPIILIDTYAALCRACGITLSSSALSAMGSDGYTICAQASKLFGRFAAFQAAAVSRHKDIKPPNRPTARDGTCLDSWQEVAVYNTMRIALPDAVIKIHVMLADTRCSCDFVLDRVCYVEVLRFGRAEMVAPRNADAQKYSRQWSAKMALYQSLGVTPVVIEPGDIHHPERLAERMAEIAAHLAISMQPLPAPSGKVVRAKGYWNFSTLCAAVAEVGDAAGRWPTYAELTRAGYGNAATMLRKPGTAARVAAKVGLALRNQKGVWSAERIIAELADWAGEHGHYPTGNQLAADGLHLLYEAGRRLFAGRSNELRSLVEQRCGRSLPRRCASRSRHFQPELELAIITRHERDNTR